MFDFDYATWGWDIEVLCNYPEAFVTGYVDFINHTTYSGSGTKEAPMMNGYIVYFGPANFSL